ncbi:unnamed protein product [Rotaria socialis]
MSFDRVELALSSCVVEFVRESDFGRKKRKNAIFSHFFTCSDYLEHDVEFVHSVQRVIVEYIQSVYPGVKKLNYVSDGAPQHFKNNKNIFNLTYHYTDFGLPASWTFCATAHGKSAVDGIGAAFKHRANRHTLCSNSSSVILTPEDLYKFARHNNEINVFYMNRTHIKHNCERYDLHDRWKQYRVEEWIKQIRSQHQFDPIGIKKVECRRTSCSGNIETNEVNN